MKKHFDIRKSPSDQFQAICFSLDSVRPDQYFEKLEGDLRKMAFEGEILLDLLACNGSTSRRFFSVRFDGAALDMRSFKVKSTSTIEEEIVECCTSFYSGKGRLLRDSVLSATSLRQLSAA